MTAIYTILRQSLTQQPRRPHFYAKRAGIAVVGGFIALWFFSNQPSGLAIAQALALVGVVATCLTAPLITSGTLAREREHDTLGLLMMSDISPASLVLGRLAAGAWTGLLVLASALPLFMLCVSLGGVTLAQILGVTAVLGALIVAASALGLLASSFAPTEKQAAFASLLCASLLFFTLPLLVVGVIDYLGTLAAREWAEVTVLPLISPRHAVSSVLADNFIGLGFCPVVLALTTLVATLTIRMVRRADTGERELAVVTWMRRLNRGRRRAFRPRKDNENPIIWRENPQSMWGLCGMKMLVLLALAVPAGLMVQKVSLVVPLTAFLAGGLVFSLGVLVRSSLAFTAELQGRSLDLLLLSGMNADDIIMGKLTGYISAYLPWLVTMGAGLALLGGQEDFTTYALASLLCIVATFAYSSLAMNFSLAGRRLTAMFAGLGGFSVSAVGGPFLLGSVGLAVGAIVVHLAFGIWMLNRLYTSFNAYANIEE